MAGAALLGRLTWQSATVTAAVVETPRARTLTLDVPGWPGHRAGQHVDIRLTAEDGYRAERAYSLASAPGEAPAITVERLEDGEVSPYLVDDVLEGDEFEVRGPVGGYFVWDREDGGPLLLIAGGSGIVPLRAIARHRRLSGSDVPTRMIYSARSVDDVIYREELETDDPELDVVLTLTRTSPPDWSGRTGRLDAPALAELAWPAIDRPLAFVCGPTSFVEAVAARLVALGYDPARVKTERFGATGGR